MVLRYCLWLHIFFFELNRSPIIETYQSTTGQLSRRQGSHKTSYEAQWRCRLRFIEKFEIGKL